MKAIKRLILFVIGLASLLIIGAVALVVLVDPNDYKGFAQDAVKKRLDLDLSITEVSWQFFPNIGLRLNGVSLTDPQQSQEDSVLIKADSATVAVALLPLLKQAIDVKNVQLNSPQIRFAQYADGRSNWDPLLKNPNVKNSSAAEAASQQIPSQQIPSQQIPSQQIPSQQAPSQPDDTPSNGAPSAPEQTADDANPLSALAINGIGTPESTP
ncbi:MAG: AsmA family protein [Gammaproteobacteria bacterium]